MLAVKQTALAAGARPWKAGMDEFGGEMYGASFQDPDGRLGGHVDERRRRRGPRRAGDLGAAGRGLSHDQAEARAPASLEAAIFALLDLREPGKTICPSEAARVVDPEGWRRLMSQVRATAVGLARRGRLVITRHGKPADPDSFKGVYRLRLPDDGEPV